MSFLNRKQEDDKSSKHPGHDKAEVENQGAEQTPEQYAGERMRGGDQKKSGEQIEAEAEKYKELNEPYIDPDAPSLADSQNSSSPNSPASIAAQNPLAPRDSQGRWKKAVPDANGVSINGRPAHEHKHLHGFKGAQTPVYVNNNPASQVHTPGRSENLRHMSRTNKLVDNQLEINKPQAVKDEQATKSSKAS